MNVDNRNITKSQNVINRKAAWRPRKKYNVIYNQNDGIKYAKRQKSPTSILFGALSTSPAAFSLHLYESLHTKESTHSTECLFLMFSLPATIYCNSFRLDFPVDFP